MVKIDLNGIITKSGLKKSFVAQELFPKNGKKNEALQRVILGRGQLNEDQIVRLSEITGIAISDLFTGNPESWKMKSDMHICTFTRDTFRAEYDLKAKTLKLFDKESLFVETYFAHEPMTTVAEVLATLEKNIEMYKKLN